MANIYDDFNLVVFPYSNRFRVRLYGITNDMKYIRVKYNNVVMADIPLGKESTQILDMKDVVKAWWWRMFSVNQYSAELEEVSENFAFSFVPVYELLDANKSVIQSVTRPVKIVESGYITRENTYLNVWNVNSKRLKNIQDKFGYAWVRPYGKYASVGVAIYSNWKIRYNGNIIYTTNQNRYVNVGFDDRANNDVVEILDQNNSVRFSFNGNVFNCDNDNFVYVRWLSKTHGWKYGFFKIEKEKITTKRNEWQGLTVDKMYMNDMPRAERQGVLTRLNRDEFERVYFSDIIESPMLYIWDDENEVWQKIRTIRPPRYNVNTLLNEVRLPVILPIL